MLLYNFMWNREETFNWKKSIMKKKCLKLCNIELFLFREVEEKRSNMDGNVDEIAKELQRMEGKKQYLEEEKTDLSEALDRQRHLFESKVIEQSKYLNVIVLLFIDW